MLGFGTRFGGSSVICSERLWSPVTRCFCAPDWASRDLPPLRRRRLVITGMGLTSPLGNSVTKFWDALLAGESGIDTILPPEGEVEDVGRYPHAKLFNKEFLQKCGTSVAATVKEPVYIDKRDQRELPLFVAYGQHAALQALHQSDLLHHTNPQSLVCSLLSKKSI